MKCIRVICLAVLLAGCDMYYDAPPTVPIERKTKAEQCHRLKAIQWCMSKDNCMVTVDQVDEAKQLHTDRVCHGEEEIA